MKIIKSKINNFLLPLFLLTLLCAKITVVYAQNEPPTEGTTVSPKVQNQAPTAETPNTTPKKETAPKTASPTENQTPAQAVEEKPESTTTKEANKQTETENQKPNPQKNKPTSGQESKTETPKEPYLPEVSDKEVRENSSSNLELPQKDNKNIIKTVVSWLLMIIGLSIIIKVIISNFRIPKNYEPHIKNKHSFKSGKKKSKYDLKYK